MATLTYEGEMQWRVNTPLPSTISIWATIANPESIMQTEVFSLHVRENIAETDTLVPVTALIESPLWNITQTIQNIALTIYTSPDESIVTNRYFATAAALTTTHTTGDSKSVTSTASTAQNPITTSPLTDFASIPYSTIPPEATTPSSSGLSSSKVAGIAIGCVIGGMIFTLLVVLFIMRHRLKCLLRTKFGKSESAPVRSDQATVFPEVKETRDPTRVETIGRELGVGDIDSVNYAFMPISR